MIQTLFTRLPSIATSLIDQSWQDIDGIADHDPDWHQWGILEHTNRVWAAMRDEVPLYCFAWHLPFIHLLKRETIAHQTKWHLLLASCLLHDLGKWAGRFVKPDGSYSFQGHEAISEQLIRSHPYIQQVLKQALLTAPQIDYIATIAGLHYELGKLRKRAYQQGGFNTEFLQSSSLEVACHQIAEQHSPYAREIGLIFLADSLAKVAFRFGLESEDGIIRKLAALKLSPNLIHAARQVPINIALSRTYLSYLYR